MLFSSRCARLFAALFGCVGDVCSALDARRSEDAERCVLAAVLLPLPFEGRRRFAAARSELASLSARCSVVAVVPHSSAAGATLQQAVTEGDAGLFRATRLLLEAAAALPLERRGACLSASFAFASAQLDGAAGDAEAAAVLTQALLSAHASPALPHTARRRAAVCLARFAIDRRQNHADACNCEAQSMSESLLLCQLSSVAKDS